MTAMAAAIEIAPDLLEPPVNLLRTGLHPQGFAPLIVNLGEWRDHFLWRLDQQIAISGDDELSALREEIAGYPVPARPEGGDVEAGSGAMLGPVRVRAPAGAEWSFFGMFAGFDTPFEVTTSELAVELLFPADRATKEGFTKGTA
jgi:hypothetical protein